MLKRILNKQLELNEYEPYGGGVFHSQVDNKTSFIEELRSASKKYTSPNIDEIKDLLKKRADDGETSLKVDKYRDLDDRTIKWLSEQGFQLKESWCGTHDEGYTAMEISWG